MRILFDHNVDRRFRRHLPGHDIKTTRQMNWEKLENGLLLQSAAGAQFDAILSIDKKIEHEQNLNKLPLPVIILDSVTNALPDLIPFAPYILKLCESPLECRLHIIKLDGQILRLGTPLP